jgi:outer membrane protein TolC
LALKGAIQYALEHSPSFDIAKRTQAIRELEYKSAVAKFLPSLDFSTTNGLQNNISIASGNGTDTLLASNPASPWYSTLSLGLSENLYDNGVSVTQLGVANLNRELAQLGWQKARDGLVLDVASEFYRYSLASVLLEVKTRQQALLEKQFKMLTGQYQQGFKTRSDYLRLKTQVQRAEIDQLAAQGSVKRSEANLLKLLGSEEGDSPSFEPLKATQDAVGGVVFATAQPAIENVYDFRIKKTQEEINDSAVSLVRRNFWPQVSVSSGISYVNQNYVNSDTAFSAGHQLSWNALLSIQYNIWDWGTRRRDVEIAGFKRDIQGDTLSQGLLDIRAQIAGLMADTARISSGYKLTRELLSAEEESNHDVETRYREGKATYLDLVTELNNLLDARVQFFTSYFDALTVTARYQYFEGKLYESLVEK